MVIDQIAAVICEADLGHPTRVAIDGVAASGKSTLAREISAAVVTLGRPAIHLTMDGYHHPRERRYRRGCLSASGYYEDAYDFAAFGQHVIIPLGPGGTWADAGGRSSVRDSAPAPAVATGAALGLTPGGGRRFGIQPPRLRLRRGQG